MMLAQGPLKPQDLNLDGTFTNRLERQCQPYEAKGIVRVQGETAEASRQPFAEVKLFDEPAKRTDK